MSKAAYYFTLLFVVVATGTISSLGPLGSFARLAAIPAIGLTLLSIYLRGTCRRLDIYHWAFFLFILWNAATYFWSASPISTIESATRYLPMVMTLLVVWENCRTRQKADGVMQAFVFGGYLIILALSFNYVSGNYASTDPSRLTAGGFNADDFLYLIPVPIAWYLVRRPNAKNKFLILLNLGYVLAAPFGIIFTATRGALLVAVPGYLYVLWSGRKAPASWKIGALAAVVVLVGLTSQLDVATKLTRLSTVTSSSGATGADSNLNGRGVIWELAIKEFTHHPLIGIGSGAFPYISSNDPIVGPMHAESAAGLPVHNTYLSVLTETGIVGFLIMAVMIAIVVCSACSLKEDNLKHAFIATLAMMAVGISSLTYEDHSGFWMLFTLIIAGGAANEIGSRVSNPSSRGLFGPNISADPPQKLEGVSD
jgi:O-antigen ligase